MAANPEKTHYSFEQYLLMLQNGEGRMEYDHGEIYAMAGSTSNHASLSANMWRVLDDALGNDATCRAYVVDKVVRLTPNISFMPDVVVSCDVGDHGDAFLLESPRLVVEVLSRSTEARDRTYKLVHYQVKESVQEIVFISQYVQRIEVVTRAPNGWQFHQYGHGQAFRLNSLDVEIEVAQVYRRLSIPVVVKETEEEYLISSMLAGSDGM